MKVENNMARQMKISDFNSGETETCIMCGEGEARRSFEFQEFAYGSVTLQARVPVWSCATCELQYVSADGERAQHEAVCRHLGRLTPTEIKAIRVGARLSQREFSEEIHCGIASLKRWETGALIQGRAADASIRTFQSKRVRASRQEPIFRTTFSDDQRVAAKTFRLREVQPMELAA